MTRLCCGRVTRIDGRRVTLLVTPDENGRPQDATHEPASESGDVRTPKLAEGGSWIN